MNRLFMLVLMGAVMLTGSPAASACDACTFFLTSTHRTGSYEVRVVLDSAVYRVGTDPRVTLTIVNHSAGAMPVAATEAVWKQTAYHVKLPSGNAGSEFDKPIDTGHGHVLAPGASYTFTPIALSRWGIHYRARGTYEFAVSYGHVDSNLVTFKIE